MEEKRGERVKVLIKYVKNYLKGNIGEEEDYMEVQVVETNDKDTMKIRILLKRGRSREQ